MITTPTLTSTSLCCSPDAASPAAASPSEQNNPGVVTPHQADVSFADPLADAAEQFRLKQGGHVLPTSGDLSSELSQVQHLIAAQSKNNNINHGQARIHHLATQQMMPVGAPHPAPMPVVAQQQPAPSPMMQSPSIQNQNNFALQPNKRQRTNGAPAALVSFAPSNGGAPRPTANGSYPPPGIAPAPSSQSGPRQKSQAQIDRRRERNRILARRTRLRKKFFFESLQKDVADLQRENAALKSIVRSRLKPDDARAILSTCNANDKLPSIDHDPLDEGGVNFGGGADGDVKQLDKEDFSLIQSIQNSQQCFVITDPSLHDNPIVYASDDFLNLTGYSQEEVLGRNCRFLQGTGTCQKKVAAIRDAVAAGEDVNVTLANYTSDGTPFWNSLFIAALRDADNNIVNFIGVIVKVAGPEPGDEEYGKVLSKEWWVFGLLARRKFISRSFVLTMNSKCTGPTLRRLLELVLFNLYLISQESDTT